MSLMNTKFSPKKLVLHRTVEEGKLGEFFDGFKKPGVFVDIGGNRPQNAVSKIFLEYGWTGLVVEPIPENAEMFRQAEWPIVEEFALTSPEKAQDKFCDFHLAGPGGEHSSLSLSGINPNSLKNRTIRVQLTTLEKLLSKHGINQINLLSIDTEGTEIDVLKGLDFDKHEIDLILCEDWHRDRDIHNYLKSKGFKIILRTGFNSWYIKSDIDLQLPFAGRVKLWKKPYISSYIKRLRHHLLKKKSSAL
jgi:FkbM family methyltransferase